MSKILGFIFLCSIQIAASQSVLELTDKNFHEAIRDNPSIIIDFYASWCGHCQHFKPIYEQAAVQAKDIELRSVLARIDAYLYTAIKREWRIGGYPTILYYQNGEFVEKYPRRRTAEDLVEYLKEMEDKLNS